MSKRIEWIDLAKGFCILMVVFGHSQIPVKLFGSDAINTVLSAFRMPLFFLLSGLFFKTYSSFLEFLKKKTYNLLVPYTFFYTLGIIVPYFMDGPIWFLLCLFLMNVWGWLIVQLTKGQTRYLLPITLLMGIIGYHTNLHQYADYKGMTEFLMRVEASVTGMPFFFFGWYVRNHTTFIADECKRKWQEMSLAIVLFAVVIVVDYMYDWADTSYVTNSCELPLFWNFALGLAGSIGVLIVARLLVHLPLISYLGRYSIIVLITHATILYFLYRIVDCIASNPTAWYFPLGVFLITVVLEIPVIWFCKRYIPYLFAQKR